MASKFLSSVAVVFLAFSLLLLGFQRVSFVSALPEFSLSEIYAVVQVVSPVDNGFYTGNVPLNISISFNVFSSGPNEGVIPYQKISCLYKVDNGEWKNASLVYTSGQQGFWNPPNANYWNYVECNYSALLEGLYNGAHVLNITLKPDGINYYRVDHSDYALNSTIVFHVYGNYEVPAPNPQTPEKPLTTTVIVVSVITISALIILIKIRKKYYGVRVKP
ncbi:MAG: hypothetical protein ACPLKQ_06810 [Candidatus Bathyarchaeales archaeon]